MTDPLIERVVLMTGARVGKTQCLNNLIGYHIHMDAAPIMLVVPSLERAEEWADDEFDPMIRDTPQLRAILGERKSRAAKQRRLHRVFPGGRLYMVGANAPSGLAAKTIRVVIQDEVDRFPASAGQEGDPVTLAERRANTIWNRKLVLSSTPTIAGSSRIEQAFLASDRRRFWVPCPHCREHQTLKWAQVRWPEGRPDQARYLCEADGCGALWTDAERYGAIGRGEWRAEAPFAGTAGFALNELYSPWRRLAETAADFVAAKDRPERLKAWVNTALGETWQERGEAPEFQRLYDRRERWEPGTVPAGGLLLTAGVDVQREGRIEISVWAWGRNRHSWLIDHIVIHGSPFDVKTWDQVDDALRQRYRHASGAMMDIRRAAVDSGDGATTQEVYVFVRRVGQNRAIAIKGQDRQIVPISAGTRVEVKRNGTKVGSLKPWHVGSSLLKGEFYGQLRLDKDGDEPPAGYVFLPEHVASEEFCRQLTAEDLRRETDKKGFARRVWVKTRANEALDCRVYARAAAALLGVDRWSDATWRQLEDDLGPVEPAAVVGPDAEAGELAGAAPAPPQRVAHRPRPSGFFGGGWR